MGRMSELFRGKGWGEAHVDGGHPVGQASSASARIQPRVDVDKSDRLTLSISVPSYAVAGQECHRRSKVSSTSSRRG